MKRMAPSPRSRTRGWRTLTGPIPGLDEAFRQISIADNPAAAGGVNKRRMATQKHGDLGLNGLGQQLASSSL